MNDFYTFLRELGFKTLFMYKDPLFAKRFVLRNKYLLHNYTVYIEPVYNKRYKEGWSTSIQLKAHLKKPRRPVFNRPFFIKEKELNVEDCITAIKEIKEISKFVRKNKIDKLIESSK